ncbi:MAG: hypothetical protein ORN29_03470 [Rhodoferax sp.]|nr:hypothetical protein [Rhodoferax sp.]
MAGNVAQDFFSLYPASTLHQKILTAWTRFELSPSSSSNFASQPLPSTHAKSAPLHDLFYYQKKKLAIPAAGTRLALQSMKVIFG